MHELLTIVTDVRGVCQSVARLELGAGHAVYAMCCVRGVIWCSMRQMPLASRFISGAQVLCY